MPNSWHGDWLYSFVLQQDENIGMAMTFTLVTVLREKLLDVVKNRIEKKKQAEAEEERRLLEVSPDAIY